MSETKTKPKRKQRPSRYLHKMDELREGRGNHCAIDATGATCSPCLDFAHLVLTPLSTVPRSRGKADRYHDIKRTPYIFALMCKRHHRAMDRAFWRWLDEMRAQLRESIKEQLRVELVKEIAEELAREPEGVPF